MNDASLRRLLEKIAATENEEISCTECFDLLSGCVELEPGSPAAERQWPQLQQHLLQCGVCRDEYETLRDLVRLDDDGRPPIPDPSAS